MLIKHMQKTVVIHLFPQNKMNRHKKIKGAMTVEASILLPVFLMLFVNLLSVIEVYRIHSSVAETLWEKGRKTAQYYYLRDTADELADVSISGENGNSYLIGIMASIAGAQQIIKDLGNYPVWEKIVVGGKGGYAVSGKVNEKGIITIDCTYRIHPLFSSLTPMSRMIENHYYGHAWTGYELSGQGGSEDAEIYVYVTETGTVYHKNRGCSYLNPSIRQVLVADLEKLRNESGAIYYACPLCDGRNLGEACYITDYGTNYHTYTMCPGLKRTIYEVKLSEVHGKGPCSKCGG